MARLNPHGEEPRHLARRLDASCNRHKPVSLARPKDADDRSQAMTNGHESRPEAGAAS
jgi:hypothetical protein